MWKLLWMFFFQSRSFNKLCWVQSLKLYQMHLLSPGFQQKNPPFYRKYQFFAMQMELQKPINRPDSLLCLCRNPNQLYTMQNLNLYRMVSISNDVFQHKHDFQPTYWDFPQIPPLFSIPVRFFNCVEFLTDCVWCRIKFLIRWDNLKGCYDQWSPQNWR